MSKFIMINDSIVDTQCIIGIQKRTDVAGDYILRIHCAGDLLFIEVFDSEEDRDFEFNRIAAMVNAV